MYTILIYVQIKFCYVIYLIVPKYTLLNSFYNHYYWNHPIQSFFTQLLFLICLGNLFQKNILLYD